jgi:hypothetical protein
MADIVQSLFGLTPEAYRQQQMNEADRMALGYAQLTPQQRASFGMARAGYQLGGVLGSALGAQDPMLQLISNRQAVARQINPNDPETMRAGILALNQAGDTVGAMQLTQLLEQRESELAQREGVLAQAQQRQAQAAATEAGLAREEQLRNELTQLGENATDQQITNVLLKYGSPDKVMAAIQSRQAREEAARSREEIARAGRETAAETARLTRESREEVARLARESQERNAQEQRNFQERLAAETREAREREAAAAREARERDAAAAREARIEAARIAAEGRLEAARERGATSREIANIQAQGRRELLALRQSLKGPNTLPAGLQKEEDKDLESIDLLEARKETLAPAIQFLTPDPRTGRPFLELGPINNTRYMAQNAAGNSTDQSRAFAALQRSVQEATNLKTDAAKGVQTDKDVLRFANELIAAFGKFDTKTTLEALTNFRRATEAAQERTRTRLESRRQSQNVEPYYGANRPRPAAPTGEWSIRRVEPAR